MQAPSDPLEKAEELIRTGYKADARRLLVGYLKQYPDSAKGWWLMSYAVNGFDQQYDCLERVLEIKPDHQKAQKRLATMKREILPKQSPIEKITSSPPILALILILGCISLGVIGFMGYRLILPSETASSTQAAIAQFAQPSSTVASAEVGAGLASTPTIIFTATRTPTPQATHTPLVSSTPTIDPNATATPIPENKIGAAVGQFPPDFTLTNAITNQEVALYDHFGQPIVLFFFNTLAKESDPQMPGLQAVYEKYQEQGLVVMGIGAGSSQSALRNYTGRFGGLTFPLFSDWEHTVARTYNVGNLPTTFFIRKNGKIWQVSYGAITESQLDAVAGSILRMP
jgi:peroxiredoxin